MYRHRFLAEVHARLRPRSYLEIGVNDGRSLTLSRVPSIAVDPAFRVTSELRCDVQLVRKTSDEFFARRDPIRHLRSGRNPIRNLRRGRAPFGRYLGSNVVDLAFIDGMHLFEFVLRDFMNVERFAGPGSVIIIDDVYPRSVDEAARERQTTEWTGDVFKLVDVLRRHRPDLVLAPVDTSPTGMLAILGADKNNRVLQDAYDDLVAHEVRPDPQVVPVEVLERRDAIEPRRFLDAPVLDTLRSLHTRPIGRTSAIRAIRGMVEALHQPLP